MLQTIVNIFVQKSLGHNITTRSNYVVNTVSVLIVSIADIVWCHDDNALWLIQVSAQGHKIIESYTTLKSYVMIFLYYFKTLKTHWD